MECGVINFKILQSKDYDKAAERHNITKQISYAKSDFMSS